MNLVVKRILVPLAFSANSTRALDYAWELANKFNAALHLVHVCDVPSVATGSVDGYVLSYTEWTRRLGEQAECELDQIRHRLEGIPVSTEVLFGKPARAIVAAAHANNADLIVMGTHGYGAMMHLVMGNVAERVVRTADCPVLTIRGPRGQDVAEEHRPRAAAAAVLSLVALLLLPLAAAAQNATAPPGLKQTVAGAELFRTYCVVCHGSAGRGDGQLASSMTRKPADLTEIAKRNGGEFPPDQVFRTIDGTRPVRGHGGPDMPVWGDAFARSRDGGNPEQVKQMIQSLVDFLESIQLRPAH